MNQFLLKEEKIFAKTAMLKKSMAVWEILVVLLASRDGDPCAGQDHGSNGTDGQNTTAALLFGLFGVGVVAVFGIVVPAV